MKLEDQVTNLELSKKLRKLCVKQESLFYWCDYGIDYWTQANHAICSAFTVAELGEMLSDGMLGSWKRVNGVWACRYEIVTHKDLSQTIREYEADTEANVRAKMLIYLLENKLVSLSS